MKNFLIQGRKQLSGSVKIGGSKNAALPIIAAALLTEQETTLHNIPAIEDIYKIMDILNHLGVETEFENNTMKIDPSKMKAKELPHELVCHMRASILLAGPLLARFGQAKMAYPGGCVLGKRPVDTHVLGLEKLGAKTLENSTKIHMKAKQLTGNTVILSEFSVTATENIIMAACLAEGKSEIRIAAAEPHVADLCKFLVAMGAKIEGIGTHTLKIKGVKKLKGVEYSVVADYLEAGTFILAAAVTDSELEIKNFNPEDLDLFFEKLEEVGVKYELKKNSVKVLRGGEYKSISHLKTAVHPGFPTDLLAPFTVLLTQAEGVSKIFETLFDGRFNFLFELEKMGASIELINPHQALVIGKKSLRGVPVASCDIRAGAATVLAGLCADGETLITNVQYIDRGYERFDEKLRDLGASIERVEIES